MGRRLHKASEDYGFLGLFHIREIGFSHPRIFPKRISASESLVNRIDLYGKLNGHSGCVNTINFNSSGDTLVSGSDDRQVILWDWSTKKSKLSYPSGHYDNIFQAKFMPFTNDQNIITASADGQVRLGLVQDDSVETKRLGKHDGRVHNLAEEPGSPYIFYSCGEDGLVQHYDLRRNSASKIFYCSSFADNKQSSSSVVRLNAIVINPRNPNYFAVGGSDEYARVYDIRKFQPDASSNSDNPVDTFCPRHLMIGSLDVHITSLAYSKAGELLVSYNDELIYLFRKDMGLGPSPSSVPPEHQQNLEAEVFSGHRNAKTVKGVNFFGPNDEYVMSGSDCGHVFIWKTKGAKLVRLMVGDRHVVNQLEHHPKIPVIATCGIEKTIKIWAPTSSDVTPLPSDVQEIMEANRRGREDPSPSRVTLTPDVIMHVLRLHRRQALAYVERRSNGGDDSDDEDGGDGYVLGFSDADAPSEEGNSRECNIS